MSFVGKLGEFQLADLLQIISNGHKSGKLSLARRDTQGVIVFRQGKIIYAASSSARETLGSLLIAQGLISEQDLVDALDLQQRASEEKRLGTILVDQGLLAVEDLERVIKGQVENVLLQFMGLEEGFFKFEPVEIADHGEVGVDTEDFILQEGLRADHVLLDLATALDEATATETAPDTGGEEATSLKSIMSEIRSPEFTGEVTVRILEFAKNLFNRGLLFIHLKGNLQSASQFGLDVGTGDSPQVEIPLDRPSLFTEVIESKTAHRGPLELTEGNLNFIGQLGGVMPTEAAVLPLIVDDEVLLVLYGDNSPGNAPLGSLEPLEILLNQTGLAMEKRMLEERIERLGEKKTASTDLK
jgi:hypothetical protein